MAERSSPSTAELAILRIVAGDIHLLRSAANISSPPTDAELDAAFGTPAEVGTGLVAFVDDAAAGSAVYLVLSDGANWWYAAMTKAI